MVAPAVPSNPTPIRSAQGWKGVNRPYLPTEGPFGVVAEGFGRGRVGDSGHLSRARYSEGEVSFHREPPVERLLPVSVVLDLGAVVESTNAGLDLLGV